MEISKELIAQKKKNPPADFSVCSGNLRSEDRKNKHESQRKREIIRKAPSPEEKKSVEGSGVFIRAAKDDWKELKR